VWLRTEGPGYAAAMGSPWERRAGEAEAGGRTAAVEWHARRTFHHSRFPAERIAREKQASVSVCLPARDEAATIGRNLEHGSVWSTGPGPRAWGGCRGQCGQPPLSA